MKILFWNTHKNNQINEYLKEIIIENHISIVVLAEYSGNLSELIFLLNANNVKMTPYFTAGCDRITILGTEQDVEPAYQSTYASFQVINKKELLCCIHLQSQIYGNNDKRREITISQIIEEICKKESEMNADNTIVVGDFNMNPYEVGCIDATCFHGIPVYKETLRKSRTISNQSFKMFYNPMWNFWGDFSPPYGTYYFNGSTTDNTYWHIYDQVIIRPSMRERFIDENLQIITQTKNSNLLDGNGHPNILISDHLPISFEIKGE